MSSKPGEKHDTGKARWDLLPFVAVGHVADVLTFGASKYTPEGWRSVPDWRSRYTAAALRHIAAWKRGESIDMESGLPHLAHAACCLLFMTELDTHAPKDFYKDFHWSGRVKRQTPSRKVNCGNDTKVPQNT